MEYLDHQDKEMEEEDDNNDADADADEELEHNPGKDDDLVGNPQYLQNLFSWHDPVLDLIFYFVNLKPTRGYIQYIYPLPAMGKQSRGWGNAKWKSRGKMWGTKCERNG